MNTSNSEYELIRQEIFRIGAKLDTLPQIYITRTEHDPWRNSVEKRFDDINRQFDEIDKLKTESARWTLEERQRIHDQIQQTERHLQDKLDKSIDQISDMHDKVIEKIDAKLEKQDNKQETSAQATWTWRQTWLVFGASTIIGLAEYIITYFSMHH